MKIIIVVIIILILVIGLSWFVPIIPYQEQVYCLLPPCSPQTKMITLNEFISLKINQRIEKEKREYISPEQMFQIKSLMKKNGKSLDGLKAYRFEVDDIGMTHIRFYIYKAGINIGESIYHFKADGTLSSIS